MPCKLTDSHGLIKIISYTSILSILLSVALFCVSEKSEESTYSLIQGGFVGERFVTHHTLLVLADGLDSITNDKLVRQATLQDAWYAYLAVMSFASTTPAATDTPLTMNDYTGRVASNTPAILNLKLDRIIQEGYIYKQWQIGIFIALLIFQIINFLFATILLVKDHGSEKSLKT